MPGPWLITGANGQLGWELARQTSAAGIASIALDRTAFDITDAEQVSSYVRKHAPGLVINAAAYTAVDKAEDDEAAAYKVNRDGPAHLAMACAQAAIPLIHISTDYVFDGSKTGPYTERDPTSPLGIYGASKLAGEDAVRHGWSRHVILRTAWVYGNHGHNFVKTMLRLGMSKDEVSVVSDQSGCPTYAADLAAAILEVGNRLLTAPSDSLFGTFHCTSSGATSWHGLADAIFDALHVHMGQRPVLHAIETKDYPTPAKRPKNSVLECSKIGEAFGVHMRPWTDGLADMLGREFESVKD